MGQLGLRHYLINDGRCGAFAADAYARVTNRPGVEALNAGTPMVAFAGDAHRAYTAVKPD